MSIPAFPQLEKDENYSRCQSALDSPEVTYYSNPGMSLRQWYAGQALVGVMVNASNLGDFDPAKRRALFKKTAKLIFEVADAMVEVGQE